MRPLQKKGPRLTKTIRCQARLCQCVDLPLRFAANGTGTVKPTVRTGRGGQALSTCTARLFDCKTPERCSPRAAFLMCYLCRPTRLVGSGGIGTLQGQGEVCEGRIGTLLGQLATGVLFAGEVRQTMQAGSHGHAAGLAEEVHVFCDGRYWPKCVIRRRCPAELRSCSLRTKHPSARRRRIICEAQLLHIMRGNSARDRNCRCSWVTLMMRKGNEANIQNTVSEHATRQPIPATSLKDTPNDLNTNSAPLNGPIMGSSGSIS